MDYRYKVGDKVRVRSGLNPGDKFRMRSGPRNGQVTYGFVDQMADMAGEILTIEHVNSQGLGYDVEENDWCWNDEMLEPAEENECICESLL